MKMLYNYLTIKDVPAQFPSIPMRLLNEEWAKRNHSQSLNRLNERGGLSPCEALANIEKRPYKSMPVQEAINALKKLMVD